jgi:photosynthetic reaction center cytochrome c subunit
LASSGRQGFSPRVCSTLGEAVKVLGELSVGEFARNMVSITQWVAPKEGCTYCHNAANFADDAKYTKVVARRMLQMTQHVNADWKSHVGATGVTCYTCHRGNPVPNQVWFAPADRRSTGALLGDLEGQNQPSPSVAYSSLPFDPLTPYLLEAKPIRVNGTEALAMTGSAANRSSTKQAEFTYALMMHFSQSLGVNCTYCHNGQAFQSWEVSPPTRSTAWYGIRMARDLNNDYMTPLTATFPANRLGPKGDVAKVACGTCHQGAFKPLYGAEMAKHHRELQGPLPVTVAAAAPAASASAASASTASAGMPASDANATGAASSATGTPAAAAPAAGTGSGAATDNKVVGNN